MKIAIFLLGILLLVGCNNKDEIIIGVKPMTEQFLLAYMYKELIENETDAQVTLKTNMTTSVLQPAIEKGDIDMYAEYSGTGWLQVLKQDLIRDPDELFRKTRELYKERYNLVWLDRIGFNNTFTLAMEKTRAAELGINTFSDLAAVSEQFSLGAEPDFFGREDGYPALQDVYGFLFDKEVSLEISIKYQAIAEDKVDVINAFSTDGRLKENNLTIFTDDKDFFPSYFVAPIVRAESLEKYPWLEEILNKLAGKITNQQIIDMNYQVEGEQQKPQVVAREFLQANNLL